MKKNRFTKVLIVILSIIAVGLIGLMIGILTGKINSLNFRINLFGGESKNLIFEENYSVDFEKISVDTSFGNVYFYTSSDDDVRVIIYSDKEKNAKVSTVNNELSIIVNNESCGFFCINEKTSKIEVYIPASYDKEIDINDNYGDIEVGKFTNATISINNDCGDIKVLGAYKIDVTNDFGDVEIGTVSVANIVQSCGDVGVDNVESIDVENKFGNIEIDKITKYLSINDDCGDVKIKKAYITKNSKIKNKFGNIEIDNTSEIYIDAKTDLGDVNIENNYRKSDITLKLDNDCGDIEVKN